MYEVSIRKSISAAHTLDIGGKCEDLHGHNFTVDVTVASKNLDSEGLVVDFRILKAWTDDVLDSEGLVVDFRILKAWTDDVLEQLDHKFLNDLPVFQGINPSSEIIARFIFDSLAEKTDKNNLQISKVTVWESNTSWATYRGNKSG